MDQSALLAELEPVAAGLLNKHLASSKEWFPHELVPWSRGTDFDPEVTGPMLRRRWIPPCAPASS